MYLHGYGTEVDIFKAVDLLKRASRYGIHLATTKLGVMYLTGFGVEKDVARAIEYVIHSCANNMLGCSRARRMKRKRGLFFILDESTLWELQEEKLHPPTSAQETISTNLPNTVILSRCTTSQ